MDRRICANCAYYDSFRQECHRYAPHPVTVNECAAEDMSVMFMTVWPPVDYADSCGEFKLHEDRNK